MMSRSTGTSRARLKRFVDQYCTTTSIAHAFTQKGLVFRHRNTSGNDTAVIEFRIERGGSRLNRDLIFLVELALVPDEYLLFLCSDPKVGPVPEPHSKFGMWRSLASPPDLQYDDDGTLLWPAQGWRLNDDVDESVLGGQVRLAVDSKLEFMAKLGGDREFWLALVHGWHEGIDYPSLWGPRAQTMLLIPKGQSQRLNEAIADAISIGDQRAADWASSRLRNNGATTGYGA